MGTGGFTRGLVLALAAAALLAPASSAQTTYPATVVSVVDGETVNARLSDGRDVSVRLIGVDAPRAASAGTPADCGGDSARESLTVLIQGQAVQLRSDPTVPAFDAAGRSYFYVDRVDGLDVGLEQVRRGRAAVSADFGFQREASYLLAQDDAELASAGAWSACGGDFHRTAAEQLRATLGSAKAFARRYYRHLNGKRYAAAWRMLGGPVKRKLGHAYRRWRAGFRLSRGVRVSAYKARLAGGRAVVAVRLRASDRDACNGRLVGQRFKGQVVLAERGDSWAIVRFRIRKLSGPTPRVSKSECPKPKRPPAPPAPPSVDCQGYDPCIAPGSDVDCAGGSGNGPRYVDGPVYVGGSDPYDLDSDGDGVGCED